jgi:hypothetical protein
VGTRAPASLCPFSQVSCQDRQSALLRTAEAGVRYVALAHNRRVDGTTKPQVLMNLGRVDAVDVDGLRRLAASIRRHFGDGADDPAGGGEAGLAAGAGPMEVADARPIGGTWLLDGLWRELGIAGAIEKAVADRRFTTAVERVLFALVANRAIAPMSKLSAAEWACEDVVVPGLASMDEDQAYRARASPGTVEMIGWVRALV